MTTTETELYLSLAVGHTKLNSVQIAFAVRDYLKYLDPSIGLIHVAEIPETEDSALAFHYDPDLYPQIDTRSKI